MLKYTDTQIVFREIPDEVTLAINLSCCPHRCKGCHSPELQTNIGTELTEDRLDSLILPNIGITCVCFMGGDNDMQRVFDLNDYIRKEYPNLKVAWYTGSSYEQPEFREFSSQIFKLDYVKIGPYIEENGPLNEKTTNQTLYKRLPEGHMKNITSELWSKD